MIPVAQPSNVEIQALSVLWHEGPSTVAKILGELPDGKDRAYTTVLTVMQNLERKRLVVAKRVARAHVYRPAQPREQILTTATREFLTNAFGGRVDEAVLAMLSAGDLTPEEKTNIERELKRHKAMAAKKTAKKAAKKVAKTPAKKAVKKAAKKAAKKPVKKVAKKAAKKPVKKARSAKKPAKKAAKKTVKKPVKKAAKKPAKKAAKKVAKKAAKKPAKKAAKKAVKKAAKKAAKKK